MIKKTDFNNLPAILPIFPLPGVVILPNGSLPLNIFEPRYIAMVESVLGTHRMIGMIQPNKALETSNELYPIGCAAKIISFSETADNRYLIELKGVTRFKVVKEVGVQNGYRNVIPSWKDYKDDLKKNFSSQNINIDTLLDQLKKYFEINSINVDFGELAKISNDQIVSAIPQICSFKDNEKQAILEALTFGDRVEVLISLLKMNLLEDNENSKDTIN